MPTPNATPLTEPSERIRRLVDELPECLTQQAQLVEEMYEATMTVTDLWARVRRVIQAVYTIGGESDWTDNEVAEVVDAMSVRLADQMLDLLVRIIKDDPDVRPLSLVLLGRDAGLALGFR